MPKATVFEFISYSFNKLEKRAVFNYKTEFEGRDPLVFEESIILPGAHMQHVPEALLEKLLQSLHIILGISYYKLYCATEVALPYKLSKEEADFWNTVYRKGLGEFLYKNNLDPAICPTFPYAKNIQPASFSLPQKHERYLVGIGGGKDSLVAAELLKANGTDITGFSVQTNKDSNLINQLVKKTGIGELKIRRQIDAQLLQPHKYAGHIPISAIYAFLGTFTAALYGYKGFVVGNEYSSNFGNVMHHGEEVNHQWSKSFEFEKLFQSYLKNSVSPDVSYFSLLRPFYEIRIVKLFSRHKKYFPYFASCNSNFKITGTTPTLWCGKCAKCVFVFTLLSAFLKKDVLVKIFGKNLYEDRELLPLFKDVLGLGTMKPFDCVGTFEESQTALYMAKEQFKDDFIVKELGPSAKLHPEVLKTQKESSIPEQFRFLGMENALILGYGREGRISKQYLKEQEKFDIAVKTPGIRKGLVTIAHTTATNIFFSKVKGENTIIGITGSKGKSTTTSLIYSILKAAGKDAEILGNIGKPMLEYLLGPTKKSKIFVLELSSYQLDDIRFSPDIAVVTNLFPEHMDYHGGEEPYYQAKKNIINFQTSNEFFVYNQKNPIVRSWLKNYPGKAVPFAESTLVNKKDIALLGEHNQSNIKAAISAAKLLGIKDQAIKKAIRNFRGLSHRLEFAGEFKGIKFYDDAISTTPDSTIMALKAVKNVDTIFLGGEDRGYDFSHLETELKKYNIRNVVLFPDSGKKMINNKKAFNILETKSMEEAVKFAYKYTKPGSTCLLSCASPSYSLWKNFEEKGDQFKKFVRQLSNGKKGN